MKRNYLFLFVFFLSGLCFFLTSCKDNDTTNTPPPVQTGTLEVFVRKDLATGVYIGSAQVRLYVSSHARDIDSGAVIQYTSDVNPQAQGAAFFLLPFARYYLEASFEMGGDNYLGLSDVVVPINTVTKYHITCTKQ